MYKVAVFTYPFLLTYFEETIAPLRDNCQIDIVPFDDQQFLLTIIPSLIDQYDGFCVFSALADKFLRQARPDIKKPIIYLDRHSVDYFKTFFMMLNENRDINFSRVLIDTSMIHEGSVRTLDELVRDIAFFEESLITYSTELSLDDFIHMESRIEKNALALWEQGGFDIIVCRFASIAAAMERAHIPFTFVYPEKPRILEAMSNLLNLIRLSKQSQGLPASIMIFMDGDSRTEFQEVSNESIRMQKALLEFSKNYVANFTIQFISKGFEILTSSHTVQKITEDFTCCQLGYYLFSTQGVNTRIAYGIGHDISSARQNARQAEKSGTSTGANCVVTEDGNVIPLQIKSTGMESQAEADSVSRLAAETGLSTITIQRIRSALRFRGNNDITNQELAEILQVTVANANRFLNALVDGGYAHVVDTKKSVSKGRPSRIYRISL